MSWGCGLGFPITWPPPGSTSPHLVRVRLHIPPDLNMASEMPISDYGRDHRITDSYIASLINFLVRSSVKRGHPLQLPCRTIEDNDPDPDANTSHAPLPGEAGFTNAPPALDALVGICVSNAHQCLALSVAFGATSVLATFAENQTKPPTSIKQHLNDIWIQLRALSRVQRRVRKARNLA